MIVRSFGSIEALASANPSWTDYGGGAVSMFGNAGAQTYFNIYRTQPNVRICVDFLARNFAQLGLHVFRRVSDTDRMRLAGHELANIVHRPNPGTTRYRLFEDLMQDIGIYHRAYWLKVRSDEQLGLVRLPPDEMAVEGALIPTAFVWTVDGKERRFAPSEIVYFSGYGGGISPMETLRQMIGEMKAASDYRQAYWANSGRFEGVLTVDKDSPAGKWTAEQRQQMREQFQQFSASGSRAGQFPLLPMGVDIKPTSFNAKDSEYLESVKLSREVVAAMYHIPQPMVGILEHATFSNIREQHKHLYQDCLGPSLEMVAEEIERQLLPECSDQRNVYVEFNIGEKLKGSFEEQAAAIVSLTGAPVLARNEGRARLNLPRIEDEAFDKPVTPLNMGQAGEEPAAQEEAPGMVPTKRNDKEAE